MKFAIGSDHRGYNLKENIKEYLKLQKYSFKDVGTDSTTSVDYPDYAQKVGNLVSERKVNYGILICGSGIGVSIAANKIRNIRAVNATSPEIADMSRRHNNANIICFGADFIDIVKAEEYLNIFINTPFEGGERHERRIQKINDIK